MLNKKFISIFFAICFLVLGFNSSAFSHINIPTPLGSTEVWQALKRDLNGSGKWNQISFADGTTQTTAATATADNSSDTEILFKNSGVIDGMSFFTTDGTNISLDGTFNISNTANNTGIVFGSLGSAGRGLDATKTGLNKHDLEYIGGTVLFEGNADPEVGNWAGDAVSNGTSTITDVAGGAHGLDIQPGDLAKITGGSTSGDFGDYTVQSTDGTNVVLDRSLSGSDSDLTVTFYKDILLVRATDGTNGMHLLGYSHQGKPVQFGGNTPAATSHNLGSEDVLIGGKLEISAGSATGLAFGPSSMLIASQSDLPNGRIFSNGTDMTIDSGSGGTLGFTIASFIGGAGEIMRADSSGVAIGLKASPSSILHIDSNAADTVAIITLENTSRNMQYFLGSGSPEGVQTGSIGDHCIDTVGGILYIKNTGNATNTGWKALTETSTNLAEMILHDNSTEMTIDSDDKQHALRLFLTGDLDAWAFDAGSTGAITDTANNSTVLRLTSVGHDLVTGDIITVTGLATASQNDVTTVTRIDDDLIDCDDITFVTGSETGTWNQGSSVIAGSMAAGTYLVHLGMSAKSASITPEITYHIYINTTQQQGDAIQFDLATSAGRGFMSQIVTIVAGDIVWVSALETGNSINITNIFSNLNLHRL